MDCSLLLAAGLLQWVEAPKPSRFPNCHMTGHNVLENLRCFGCSSSQKKWPFSIAISSHIHFSAKSPPSDVVFKEVRPNQGQTAARQ